MWISQLIVVRNYSEHDGMTPPIYVDDEYVIFWCIYIVDTKAQKGAR